MRNIEEEQRIRAEAIAKVFAGKTIASVDGRAANTMKFNFTDGTSTTLWAEQAIYTPAGFIAGIFLDEEINRSREDGNDSPEP